MSKKRTKGLFEVLAAMAPGERKLFAQYLNFAPFNNSSRITQLFHLIESRVLSSGDLSQRYEDFVSEDEILHSQVEKVGTQLHQKLDQFLTMERIMASPARYVADTLVAYQQLVPGSSLIEKQFRKLSKTLAATPQSYERNLAEADLEHHYVPTRIVSPVKGEESVFAYAMEANERSYYLRQLQFLCARINESRLMNKPWPLAEIDAFKKNALSFSWEPQEIEQAYRDIFHLLETDAPAFEDIQSSIKFMDHSASKINRSDLLDILHYLLNVSFRQIDHGKPRFVELAASVYRQLLENGLLTQNGTIHEHDFKNIISLHGRIGAFEWSNDFIDEYSSTLSDDHREFLPDYCRGLLDFYQGDFQRSAVHFRKLVQKDPDGLFWGFESRNLLMKSLFMRFDQLEDHEMEELFRLSDSFKMYVRRNLKLSEYHHKSYQNFALYFSKILKLREGGELKESKAKEILQAIEKEEFMTNLEWLREVLKG